MAREPDEQATEVRFWQGWARHPIARITAAGSRGVAPKHTTQNWATHATARHRTFHREGVAVRRPRLAAAESSRRGGVGCGPRLGCLWWLLAPLLALLLGHQLLAGHHGHQAATHSPIAPAPQQRPAVPVAPAPRRPQSTPIGASPARRHRQIPVAGMPVPAGGNVPLQPIHAVIALGPEVKGAARRRELHALGLWMTRYHRAASRVTVIDGDRVTAPLSGAQLAHAPAGRFHPGIAGVLRRALRHRRGSRSLLVRVGAVPALPLPPGTASLHIDAVPGDGVPRQLPLGPGRTATIGADLRPRRALAAVVARAVMAVSQQRELR